MQAVLRCQVCGEDIRESWYPWGSRSFHEAEVDHDMRLLSELSDSQKSPPTVATIRTQMRVVPQPEPQLRYLGQPSIVSEEEFLSDVGVQRRLDPLIEPAVPGPESVTHGAE